MPLYTTAGTATALNVPQKWLDNLLSHNKIDGVQQARQGVARRLSLDAVMTIDLAKTLHDRCGIPTTRAVEVAEQLIAQPTQSLAPGLTLTLDIAALRNATITRLAEAIEGLPTPQRGRPRGT